MHRTSGVITLGPTFALTTGTLERRRYFGVLSITICGKPASRSLILPLSMISMDTVCAAASNCSCCAACFFSAFFPKKYNAILAIISTAKITSNTIVTLLGEPPNLSFFHGLHCTIVCGWVQAICGFQTGFRVDIPIKE